MKRTTLVIVSILFFINPFTIQPIHSQESGYDFEIDGLFYKITDAIDSTVMVTFKNHRWSSSCNDCCYYVYNTGPNLYDCYNPSGGKTIPSKVNGYTVTEIGPNAFRNCSDLTSIYIPSSVKRIGEYAFSGCRRLAGVLNLPDSIVKIGDYAFQGTSYTSINHLPNTLKYLSGFTGCSALTGEITIPISCDTIGEGAFSGCTRITYTPFLELDSTTYIGSDAFGGWNKLVSVNLPNIKFIGSNAFKDCSRLINVHWGNRLRSIGSAAFKNDIRLVYSGFPDSLTHIGGGRVRNGGGEWESVGAFENCTSIVGDITIPENVNNIGDYAFSGCSGITSLSIRSLNPPIIYDNTFENVDINIPVYVPCGRVLYYYVSNYWENFPNLLEDEPYEITLTSNDEMMGTVEVSQAATCNNHRARISAIPQDGYHFLQWSDGNTENPRIVALSSDSTFHAIFAINYIGIQVHSSDSIKGNVTGTGRYYYQSPVTLTAVPNNNYHFLYWNDGNTQNPRYLSATCDSTFTAIFVSNVSTITIGNRNPEMGSVSGGGVYYYQNYVTFSANPYYGHHFTQWSDGNMENPRTIMVDRDTTFTASFALNLYAVSINSVNSSMGYVSGTGNYTYNTTIGITATPNYGYHFTQWNDGNTNNPRTIVVSKDTMFTAQFAANSYQLSVSANYPLMGSAYGAGTYNYNTQTTLAAAPNYGYHFIQWSDGNAENPRLVTVTHNAEYEAQFAPNLYTINTSTNNPVCGSASGGGSFNYLSSISIVATPNYGYHFTQWSDGNTDNPRTITVMDNGAYMAQFAINSYAMEVSSNSSGRGITNGSGSYVYNSAATISATPYYGYHFTQWNDGSTENPRTVVITQDAQYIAQFDYNIYQLNTYCNDITIGNVVGGGTYNFNSQVSITAIPVLHYHFERWNDSTTDNPRTVVLTRDTSLTAIFSIDRHNISVLSGNSLMGNTQGSGSYNYGASVFITAVPNYGYHFESWVDGNTQNPRRIVVANDSNFTATFGINRYTITTASNDTLMGIVSSSATYDYNTSISLYATPAPGHHFEGWNDGNTENPRNLIVTGDSSFVAQFAINTYLLTIAPNDTAMGYTDGGGFYNYRERAILTATAAEHCHFVQWNDGNTQNPRLLTIFNDSSFVAQFVADDQFDLNVISMDANAGSVEGSGRYYVGTRLYISALPDEHYTFIQWTDGNTDNPRLVTVLGNATYIACFEAKEYEISVFPNNESMGSVSGGGIFRYGTSINISAYPSVGYHFVSWNDGDVNAIRTVVVEETTAYVAEFAEGVNAIDYMFLDKMEVWPNPVTDILHIRLSPEYSLQKTELQVFDIYGRIVQQVAVTDQETTLSVSTLPAGIYLLRVNSAGASNTVKFVKE